MNQKNITEKIKNILLLDAGGFSAGLGSLNKIKTEYLLKGFMMMNYRAVNLGYRDFLHGSSFIEEMQKKHDVPFISSNIYNSDTDQPLAKQYKIETIKDNGREIRIGILGVESKNSSLIPAHRRQGGALLEARDPVETVKAVINQIKDNVDIFICLAHMRLQSAKTLATAVPELDVIILGNDFRNQETVVNDGKTRIFSAGRQGKYVGDLNLDLDENKNIVTHKHVTVALDEKIKSDPKYATLVTNYKKERIR